MDERKEHLLRKPINEQILRHYRYTVKIFINATVNYFIISIEYFQIHEILLFQSK